MWLNLHCISKIDLGVNRTAGRQPAFSRVLTMINIQKQEDSSLIALEKGRQPFTADGYVLLYNVINCFVLSGVLSRVLVCLTAQDPAWTASCPGWGPQRKELPLHSWKQRHHS